MGFAIAGGLAAAGGIASGLIGANASSNAANEQAQAAAAATAEQQREFGIEQTNAAPYLAAGTQALGTLQGDMSSLNAPFTAADYQESPGYQFQLQQGEGAMQASAAARGLSLSTGTMAGMNNYAQGAANTDYQQAFNNYQTQNAATYNHLAGVAGLGQTAVGQTNAAAQNAGNNISSNIIGAGNAQAAGTVGSANAIGGAINGAGQTGMNTWLMQQILGQQKTGTPITNAGMTGVPAMGTGVTPAPQQYNLGTNMGSLMDF
jgi:hypothetical protein